MNAGLGLALAVVSSVAGGLLSDVSAWDAAAAAAAACSLALLIRVRRVRTAMLVISLCCASVADGAQARERALHPPVSEWLARASADRRDAAPVRLRGVLARDASPAAEGIRLLIDVDRVEDRGGFRSLPGRLQAHVSGGLGLVHVAEWTRGRRIDARVLLREPQVWRNPGSPSERWERLRRPSDLIGTIKSAALVEVARGPWWEEAAASGRRRVRDSTRQFLAQSSPQAAAIVVAILIGDRAGLADDVQRRLQAAGTYHVIAISGGNIAVLTSLSLVLLRALVRPFRLVALLVLAEVLTYGWIVGGEPSVRRAVTAAAIYLMLQLAGLVPRPLNVLGLAAASAALIDPRAVLDAGAWLSFGATLGIILGARPLTAWATRGATAPGRTDSRGFAMRSFARTCWLAGLDLMSVTAAAELALLPISVALFSRVSLLGLLLNVVAIPAMTVVQIAGLTTVALAGWWDAAARLSAWVASVAASCLTGSSRAVDLAPWFVWRVPPGPLVWTVAFYAALVALVSLRERPRWRRGAAVAACLSASAIVFAPGVELAAPAGGRLRMTMLDVGQGDAILVQFPDAHTLLVDAGGVASGAFDIGDRVVTPALWASGVRHLDWLALTHGDADHVGGAPAIERNFHPREIWEGIPVPSDSALQALRNQAHADAVVWRRLLAGHALEVGGVTLEVVNPPAPDWERRRVRNDDSVVVRIRFGRTEFLLTGDAGAEFEERFVPTRPPAPLRVLKVGHHGSRTSSSARFVESLSPEAALISVGRANPFGHPTPDVIARYERIGTVVFRTDRDGAAVLETDGAVLDIKTMSGRAWRMSAR